MIASVNANSRAARLVWGIPLTSALMAGFTLLLVYIYIQNETHLRGYIQLWLPCLYFIGTALGGAIGVRIAFLSWRQVIISSVLAGIALLILKKLLLLLLPWTEYYYVVAIYQIIPFFLVLIAAGTFLLPLFDPAVRKSGPAPSLWKVVLTAVLLCLGTILSGVMVHNPFAVMFIGILPAAFGSLIALILSLANQTHVGAWLGGLAVLVPLLILALSLLGYPF